MLLLGFSSKRNNSDKTGNRDLVVKLLNVTDTELLIEEYLS